ncbi:MAG: MFS transporter, partial [Fimbriimonadales bacterium]|nr:MFS transporter [Fimbriimonadales bacterium]
KEMQLSTVLITFVLTWDNYINMFLQPVVGTLSDRTRTRIGRRKPWVLAGSPLAATAFLLVPLMATPSGVMLTIFLTNLGMALFRSPGVALIGDLYPSRQRSLANGIINLMVGLGAALAYYAGGTLYGLYGRNAPFLFGSGVMLLALVVILLFVHEPARLPTNGVEHEAGLRESLRAFWQARNPSLVWMLLAIFCWFMGFTALEALLSLYGKYVLGIPPDQMGRMVAILALMMVLFAVPSGLLATRFGRKRIIGIGVAGLILLLLYGFFVQSPLMLMGFLAPAGLCWALINVNSLPALYDTTPQLRAGVLTGLYYFASNLSAVAGPQLAGRLVDLTGDNYRLVFLYGAFFMVLAGLCLRRVKVL